MSAASALNAAVRPPIKVWPLALLGGALAVLSWVHATCPGDTDHSPYYMLGIWVGFLLLCPALAFARLPTTLGRERLACGLVLVFAIAARVPYVAKGPIRSTDVFRYMWDGKLQRRGINPYVYTPDEASLEEYRAPYHHWINNPTVKTIYPPVSQLAFRLVADVAEDSVLAYKTMFALFDLGTTLVLFGLMALLRRPPSLALLYAWNPLAITEFSGNPHHDGIGIFFLTLAIYLTLRARGRRPELRPAVALAAATMAKGYAIVALPFLAQCRAFRVRWFAFWFALAAALLLVPYIGSGSDLFSGLATYSAHWQRNDSLFSVIVAACRPSSSPEQLARMIGSALILLYIVLMALARRREPADTPAGDMEMMQRAFYAFAMAFFLFPCIYPWYLAWLLPLLAVYPHAGGLMFVAQVSLCYCTEPRNPADLWVRFVEYVPVYALFLAQPLFDRLRAREPQPEGPYLTPAAPASEASGDPSPPA